MKTLPPRQRRSKRALVPRRTTREAEALAATEMIELVPLVLPLKRILVPVDFSRTSLKALHYAVPIAKQFGARLILLHVIEFPNYCPEIGYVGFDAKVIREDLEKRLRELARRAVPQDIAAEIVVECGAGFDAIATYAKKRKVDLVILTTHGYTGLKHVFLGSTAERVVRHAPCPVLVVR